MPLSDGQQFAIEVSARAMSVLSLLGSSFIIATFLLFPFFRKPINRLIFFASLGNVVCNVATFISVTGILYGPTSGLCRFQGVLIQWFIPADSLWTFCMALNVHKTFYNGYDSQRLRALEKWYLLFCYGIPFIPALTYLILDAAGDFGIYGPATLWCWISVEHDWMRIAFFYGPVWLIILATTAIYTRTGREIFKRRKTLRSFSKHQPGGQFPPVVENPFQVGRLNVIAKVTDIKITHERIGSNGITKPITPEDETRSSYSSTHNLASQQASVAPSPSTQTTQTVPWPIAQEKAHVHDQDPATNFIATVTAGSKSSEDSSNRARKSSISTPGGPRRKNASMADAAAYGYAKVAILMFLALFVVWVPSTINRVYSLAHPTKPNFGLNLASALVLPLQGFWNATVYITTSFGQCKQAFETVFHRRDRRSSTPLPVRRVVQSEHIQLSQPHHSRLYAKRQANARPIDSRDTDRPGPSLDLSEFGDINDVEAGGLAPSDHKLSQFSGSEDSTTTLPLPRQF